MMFIHNFGWDLFSSSNKQIPNMDDELHLSHKRSTMLLNKLMNALQKATEKEESASREASTMARSFVQLTPDSSQDDASSDRIPSVVLPSIAQAYQVDLRRRAEGDRKMFWRCYFNAVSCFWFQFPSLFIWFSLNASFKIPKMLAKMSNIHNVSRLNQIRQDSEFFLFSDIITWQCYIDGLLFYKSERKHPGYDHRNSTSSFRLSIPSSSSRRSPSV